MKIIPIMIIALCFLNTSCNQKGECISGDCENGYGTMKFDTGIYEGEWKNGKMEGKGTFYWKEKAKHVGEFKNNEINGYGTKTTENGITYTGFWENGKLNGTGILIDPRGCYYEGEFKQTIANGKGKMIMNLPELKWEWEYIGEIKENAPEGKGIMTFPNKTKYVGEFKRFKPFGEGVLYNPDGSIMKKGRWDENGYVGN